MNNRREQKIELIKNGVLGSYLQKRKDQWNNNEIPTENPSFYNVTEEEKELLDALEKSTKRTKANFRKHVSFMSDFYDNIALLTLSFSDKALDNSTFKTKRTIVRRILDVCFEDFIGLFEISPNGRLHAHFIVAWNGKVETFVCNRYDEKKKKWFANILAKKQDLQDLWYGEKLDNGQPSKYGIYDLVIIDKTNESTKKIANYTTKTLNTMESYITKEEEIDFLNIIDDELVVQVNTANIITRRNTPYQKWNNDRNEQDKEIKRKARVFETSFYNENKFKSKKIFREWAIKNKDTKATNYLRLFENDFELVEMEKYRE